MTDAEEELTPLTEVCDVLTRHASLMCVPRVDCEDGRVTLTLTLTPERQRDPLAALETIELMNELRYVMDVCQIRAFATRYGIDPAKLEALLPDLQGG